MNGWSRCSPATTWRSSSRGTAENTTPEHCSAARIVMLEARNKCLDEIVRRNVFYPTFAGTLAQHRPRRCKISDRQTIYAAAGWPS